MTEGELAQGRTIAPQHGWRATGGSGVNLANHGRDDVAILQVEVVVRTVEVVGDDADEVASELPAICPRLDFEHTLGVGVAKVGGMRLAAVQVVLVER